jgi:hypothetical protein
VSYYIFRFPENTPKLRYKELSALLDKACDRPDCHLCEAKIGTTVTVRRCYGDYAGAVSLKLYSLELARIWPDRVEFTPDDDPHQATTQWISRIVQDNRIGSTVWRARRRKADGPGPWTERGRAGLLCVSGDRGKPVFGQSFPVGEPWTPLVRRG